MDEDHGGDFFNGANSGNYDIITPGSISNIEMDRSKSINQ